MPRKQATGLTHRKGLGNRHKLQRERLLRQHRDGIDLCPYCTRPMWLSEGLDADHEIPRALAGPHALANRLAHRGCNRSAGASLGNRMRAHGEQIEHVEVDRTGLAMQWP